MIISELNYRYFHALNEVVTKNLRIVPTSKSYDRYNLKTI